MIKHHLTFKQLMSFKLNSLTDVNVYLCIKASVGLASRTKFRKNGRHNFRLSKLSDVYSSICVASIV